MPSKRRTTPKRDRATSKVERGSDGKLEVATANAKIDGGESGANERVVTCYNASCPDYRVARNSGEPCGCRRTRVAPSTVTF